MLRPGRRWTAPTQRKPVHHLRIADHPSGSLPFSRYEVKAGRSREEFILSRSSEYGDDCVCSSIPSAQMLQVESVTRPRFRKSIWSSLSRKYERQYRSSCSVRLSRGTPERSSNPRESMSCQYLETYKFSNSLCLDVRSPISCSTTNITAKAVTPPMMSCHSNALCSLSNSYPCTIRSCPEWQLQAAY